MPRLPMVGADGDNWGALLNDFLLVSHNEDGTLRANKKFPAIVTPKEFGSIDGKDDHIQVQQALNSGYPVLLDENLVFGGRVNVPPCGSTVMGPGYGKIVIRQENLDESHFHLENSKNTVLEGFQLAGKTRVAAIHIKSSGGNTCEPGAYRCEHVYLGNIFIAELGATGVGIHLEQTGIDTIYFTTISNCTIYGGSDVWQEKIGIRLSSVNNSIVVGTRIFGGRFFRLKRGHSLENCDTTKVYGAAFDDCQGGNGRAVYLDFAGKCEYIGCRFEPESFDKVLEFTGRSSDNIIGAIPPESSKDHVIDEGVRNGWYGSDGSGGLSNRLPGLTPVDQWETKQLKVVGDTQLQKANISALSINRDVPTETDAIVNTHCDLGGAESGTGPGGSAVTFKYNFPYEVSAVYLATMTGVSLADSQHYAHYVSMFTEIAPGQFIETNLVDKKSVITDSNLRLLRNEAYIGVEVTTTGNIPGETVSVKRNLIRLA